MEGIKNGTDLKKHVYPALTIKTKELRNIGFRFINQNDIWDVLFENVWSKQSRVALCDIVDDILNYNNDSLYRFYLNKKEKDEKIELPKLKQE